MAINRDNRGGYQAEFVLSIIVTVLIAFAIAFWGPGSNQMDKVKVALAYGLLILLFLSGFLILAAIASGKIDISGILSEADGKASMSRFQLLIFIFVIGMSFFLIVLCECKFPEVPVEVLTLLGISATTYGVSKGIQASAEARAVHPPADTTVTTVHTTTGQQPPIA